jgi:O-antigen/teichoic acid export membrane protein
VFASAIVLGSQFLFFRVRLAPLAAGELAPEATEVRLLARQMRAYANPFVAWAAIAWLQQASDRWLLAAFSSRVQVGLYQTLNQVGYSPLVQLSGLLSQVAAPILFAQAGDGSDCERVSRARHHVHQLSALLLAGTFTLAGVLWVLGSTIFALVVAPEYHSVARYLPFAALAGGFFATGQMLTTDALLRFRSNALIAPKIGSALLAAILNYAGARMFGLPGVVWASLISTAIYMLWFWQIARRAGEDEALSQRVGDTTAPDATTRRHVNHPD